MSTVTSPSRRSEIEVLTLDRCASGSRVTVTAIHEDDHDGCRLRELGLHEGAEVLVVTAGDPVVLCVFHNRFAICSRCARNVTVAPVLSPASHC